MPAVAPFSGNIAAALSPVVHIALIHHPDVVNFYFISAPGDEVRIAMVSPQD
jgi:hypothetical protein